MTRFITSIVFACGIATAVSAAEPPGQWVATLPDGGKVRVAVEPPDDKRFAHLSWCKAVRAPDGTIVLAYTAGIFHGNHGGGSPAVSISTDNGQTFSAPQVLREFGKGKDYTQSGNLALGVAGDGALVILAMAYTGNDTNHIFGWRSTDSGRTWTPTDTGTLGPDKTGSVFGNFVNVPGKGLIVLGHYRAGSSPYTSGIWMAASNDDGKSWGEPRSISAADAAEPVLVSTEGRLIAFLRGKAKKGQEYVAVSDDQGENWVTRLSDLAPENPKTHSIAAPCAVVNPENPNEMLVLTNERGNPGRFWLWRGDAKKLEFKRERVLLEIPRIEKDNHTDYGYPWLLHVSGRKWMMFYYHGLSHGPNAIWVADVEL
jgi:hypothetical protein